MSNIREIRLERLQVLLREAGGKQAELARRIKRSPSQLNQWLAGVRTITEDTARDIERRCDKEEGWMDLPAGADQVNKSQGGTLAQSVSLTPFTVPNILRWRDLMSLGELPAWFTLEMPDKSLLPNTPENTRLIFERHSTATPGSKILVKSGDKYYVRILKSTVGDHWIAKTTNPDAFTDLDSREVPMTIVAVCRFHAEAV